MIERFQIESNIPVPKVEVGKKAQYPFRELQIGDSFWAPTKTVSTGQWTRQTGFKYSYRREFKDGLQGVRVWRIA